MSPSVSTSYSIDMQPCVGTYIYPSTCGSFQVHVKFRSGPLRKSSSHGTYPLRLLRSMGYLVGRSKSTDPAGYNHATTWHRHSAGGATILDVQVYISCSPSSSVHAVSTSLSPSIMIHLLSCSLSLYFALPLCVFFSLSISVPGCWLCKSHIHTRTSTQGRARHRPHSHLPTFASLAAFSSPPHHSVATRCSWCLSYSRVIASPPRGRSLVTLSLVTLPSTQPPPP